MKAVWFVLGILLALAASLAFGQEQLGVTEDELLRGYGYKVLRTFTGAEVVVPAEVPGWNDYIGPVGYTVSSGITGIAFFRINAGGEVDIYIEFYNPDFQLLAISWGPPDHVQFVIDFVDPATGEPSGVLGIAKPDAGSDPDGIGVEKIRAKSI